MAQTGQTKESNKPKGLYFLLGLAVGMGPLLFYDATGLSNLIDGDSQGAARAAGVRTSVMQMRGNGNGGGSIPQAPTSGSRNMVAAEDCAGLLRSGTAAHQAIDPPSLPALPQPVPTGGGPPGLSFAKWRAENAALKFEALDRGLRSILTNDWSSPKEGPDPEFNVTVHTCAPLSFAPPSYNKSFLAHHTTRSFSPPTFPHATHQSSPTWCDALGRWSGTRTGSMGW